MGSKEEDKCGAAGIECRRDRNWTSAFRLITELSDCKSRVITRSKGFIGPDGGDISCLRTEEELEDDKGPMDCRLEDDGNGANGLPSDEAETGEGALRNRRDRRDTVSERSTREIC